MQLEIGKIYTDEMLAEWFGIKKNSFKTAKKRKMAELEEYCTFERISKTEIRVLAIKTSPEYVNPKKHNYAAVREDFNKVWDVSGLDTCINVGEIIFAERHKNDKFFTLTLQTTQNYARLVRNELFGKPFDEKGGKLGTCRYVWCKSTPQGLELFNDEDNVIKKKLQLKYLGDCDEKQILIEDMIRNKEITEEEAWGYFRQISHYTKNDYMKFLQELKEKLGCSIVRGTMVDRNTIALKEISAF